MENNRRWNGALGLIALGLAACGGDPPDDGLAANEPATLAQDALRSGRHDRGPRLRSPLSATISTSRRPLLRWSGTHGDTVRVDICRDRACDHRIDTFLADGISARPPHALPAGVVFWRVTEGGGRHRDTSAVWQLVIPARESGRPGSWGAVPDFNGDGLADLAVTALGVGAPPPANELRIFPGRRGGPAATPAQTFQGGDGFGFESGPVGDLDGDGFCDLAVWTGFVAPNRVTIFRGGADGVSPSVVFPTPAVAVGAQAVVVPAGDVNDDGYGDMLVGGDAFAQLFLGGPTGVRTTAALNLPSLSSDAHRVVGGADFNGDGFPDAIVASGSGGGQIFYGDGRTLVPSGAFPTQFPGLAGDVNADGIADLADYTVNTGGPSGPTIVFQAVAGTFARATAGDTNRDGFSDVLTSVSSLVGVPETLRVYFGGRVGCTTNDCDRFAPILVPGTLQGDNIAYGASGIGDVNGDGFDDVAVYIPGNGVVHLLFGSRSGPPPTPSQTITADPGFGFSVGHL
jgi:hypothetical protein